VSAGARALARNLTASYGVRGLRALMVLALTPYLFRQLGVAGFGAWSVLFAVASMFSFVQYSATVGVTKYVAEHHEAGRTRELRETVSAAVAAMAGLGVLSVVAAAALGAAGGGLVADRDADAFRTGLLLIGAAQLIRLPGQVYGAVLMGRQRFDLFNLGEAVTLLTFAIGAVAAMETGGGLGWLAAALAASLVTGSATHVALARRLDPGLPLRPRRTGPEVRRRVIRFGTLSALIDGMDLIAQRLDTLVVAAIRGATAAASIGAATRLISGVQALILPFVVLLLPMVAELDAAGRREELTRRFFVATRIVMQVTLVAAGGLAILATDVVETWLGPAAPAGTDDIVLVLMLVQVVTLTATPSTQVLLGLDRLRAAAWLAVAEGAGNLGLSIVLVSAHGAIGAALATLFTSAVIVPLRIPLACRAIGCRLGSVWRAALLPALAGAAPSLALMGAVVALLEPGALRLAVGLGLGWGAGLAIGAAQLRPWRAAGLAFPRRLRERRTAP
jgi:O-antigen/teichoic acid export membrane protein